MSEFKKGDLVIFIRDNTAAGGYYGEVGEVVTLVRRYGIGGGWYINGHAEYDREGRRRNWFGYPNTSYVLPMCYEKDIKKLGPVDVGDLEDDL